MKRPVNVRPFMPYLTEKENEVINEPGRGLATSRNIGVETHTVATMHCTVLRTVDARWVRGVKG